MKIALDEGVPEGLIEHLPGHHVQSVRQLGLKSVKNGQLLAFIERAQFDAFVTNDKKMEAEGQLSRRPFAILILSATNWNGALFGDGRKIPQSKRAPKRCR